MTFDERFVVQRVEVHLAGRLGDARGGAPAVEVDRVPGMPRVFYRYLPPHDKDIPSPPPTSDRLHAPPLARNNCLCLKASLARSLSPSPSLSPFTHKPTYTVLPI